jgi:signal transduction histidine kinase
VDYHTRLVTLLQEKAADTGNFLANDKRGRNLPAYLEKVTNYLIAEKAALTEEARSLQRNVEHIREIVVMQQTYARAGGFKEPTNLVEVVEDSLSMNAQAFSLRYIEVTRKLEKVPTMMLEKHKILLILMNLLHNARYACEDSSRVKSVTVRLVDSGDRVQIIVSDNGVGIAPENLTRIFNHGFTTRKGGHGFGLHSAALAAREMGGFLRAKSEGLNQGATFTLVLPKPTDEFSYD